MTSIKAFGKTIGLIVLIYISARLLIASIFPGGGGAFATVVDAVMVIAVLLGIVSAITGGRFGALTGIKNGMGLILGLVVLTILIAMFTGSYDENYGTLWNSLIDVIPFGKYIAGTLGVAVVTINAPFVDFPREIVKLLLQMVLDPTIKMILLAIVFKSDRESDSFFSFRKLVVTVFSKAYAAYTATFLFVAGVNYFVQTLNVSELVVGIALIVIAAVLLVLVLKSPISIPAAQNTRVVGRLIIRGRGVLYYVVSTIVYDFVAVLVICVSMAPANVV